MSRKEMVGNCLADLQALVCCPAPMGIFEQSLALRRGAAPGPRTALMARTRIASKWMVATPGTRRASNDSRCRGLCVRKALFVAVQFRILRLKIGRVSCRERRKI